MHTTMVDRTARPKTMVSHLPHMAYTSKADEGKTSYYTYHNYELSEKVKISIKQNQYAARVVSALKGETAGPCLT